MAQTTTVHEDELQWMRDIAASHEHGAAMALFAATGAMPDRNALARDIEAAQMRVEERKADEPHVDYDGLDDELYELRTFIDTHLMVYGVGVQATSSPQASPSRIIEDAGEAIEAFVELVRDFAHGDDDVAATELSYADYDCFCGHGCNDHDEDGPCEAGDCDCAAFQSDFGDHTPDMATRVNATLDDEPPIPGESYTLMAADFDGMSHTFWLRGLYVPTDVEALVWS